MKRKLAFVRAWNTGIVHLTYVQYAYAFCDLHLEIGAPYKPCDEHEEMYATCVACVADEASGGPDYGW